MKTRADYVLPPDKEKLRKQAVKLEWITFVVILINVGVLYLVLGNSQAMRTAWVEDILALVPPLAFLIATRFERRPPNQKHPYGYVRSISIGFLVSAFALLVFGSYMLFEAVMSLVREEHPTIGTVTIFGEPVWLGWLMVAALIYTGIPPMLIGFYKRKIADRLHDKMLRADADMNKADWMTSLSGVVGVIGIGFGFWWLDAVAAIVIAADIVKDGANNLKRVVQDLTDTTPRKVSGNERDPLPDRICEALERLHWVREAQVRLREEGHVFTGEGFVVVQSSMSAEDLVEAADRAVADIRDLDWRLYDFVIVPVPSLDPMLESSGGGRR